MAKGKAAKKPNTAAKPAPQSSKPKKAVIASKVAEVAAPTAKNGKKGLSTTSFGVGVRRSLTSMQKEYDAGNHKPMDDLVRAWVGIQALSPKSKLSFFYFGSLHGLPFEERAGLSGLSAYERYQYWGGYCNHGNVLFPTWHRAYVLGIEKALQSIVPGICMPYWDATDAESLAHGVPDILTRATYVLDGKTIKNPLRSYVLPVAVSGAFDVGNVGGPDYSKPKGNESVRYPLSGLVATPEERAVTEKHNAQFKSYDECVTLLNANVVDFLTKGRTGNPPTTVSTTSKFEKCLQAPNYTVFSNTTSKGLWNQQYPAQLIESLEAPHNEVHLMLGGYDFGGDSWSGAFRGANGDIGENENAGFDPIFYFLHCNIDRVFWLWQERHQATAQLELISGYAGTNNSLDGQGPTKRMPLTELSLTTPLRPFRNAAHAAALDSDDRDETYFTSIDMVNITALGYSYEPGSLGGVPLTAPAPVLKVVKGVPVRRRVLMVTGVDRAYISGSFVIRALARTGTAKNNGETFALVGTEHILSRGNITTCPNCMTHHFASAVFSLDGFESVADGNFVVKVDTRRPPLQPLEYTVKVVTL